MGLRQVVWGTACSMVVVACLVGCKENPGTWPTDRVAAKVSENLNVTGLTLMKTDKGLEGSGKTPEGETIKVIVSLEPGSSGFRWKAEGDHGSVIDGSYYLE